jgi:hypothetical protein
VLDGKVLFPVICQALVEGAVLVGSDVLRVSSPKRLRLVELFIFCFLLLDLLCLLWLLLIINFFDFRFFLIFFLDLGLFFIIFDLLLLNN